MKYAVLLIHSWSHHDWLYGWSHNVEAELLDNMVFSDAKSAERVMLDDYERRLGRVTDEGVEASVHGPKSLVDEAVLKYSEDGVEHAFAWKITKLTERKEGK